MKEHDSSSSSAPIAISGVVQLGPVSNSTVTAYCIGASGTRETSSLGSTTTGTLGQFKLELASTPTCTVLLASTGGSYKEEADGSAVSISQTEEIEAYLGSISNSKDKVETSINSLTHAVSDRAKSINDKLGSSSKDDIEKALLRAKEEVRLAVGLPEGTDINHVVPSNPNSPANDRDSKENKVALILAGLSEMAKKEGSNSLETSKELGKDLADGVVDKENWTNLPTHIDNWMAGSLNSGGYLPPSSPFSPVKVPPLNPVLFPLPEATQPAHISDSKYFTKAHKIIVSPVNSALFGADSSCSGPHKIQVFNRNFKKVVVDSNLNLGIRISNQPLLTTQGSFSLHTSQADCLASANSISRTVIPSGTNEVSIWLKAPGTNFGYPIDFLANDLGGKLPPSSFTLHMGSSTLGVVATKRALRWEHPSHLQAGVCEGPFFLKTINSWGSMSSAGTAVNINLNNSSSRGSPGSTGSTKFYLDSNCSNSTGSISIASSSAITAPFYASIPVGSETLSLVADAVGNSNVLGHALPGLHVLALDSHFPRLPSALPSTSLSPSNLLRLRIYTQYSGAATVQETIDFVGNTLKVATSGGKTIQSCSLNSTALDEYKTLFLTAGLCDYGLVDGGCLYGQSVSADTIQGVTQVGNDISSIESCRNPGVHQIVDFCQNKRPELQRLLRKIYASKVNCQ